MNAREYLEQIQVIDVSISQDQELLDNMKLKASSGGAIRYDKDKVQTSIVGSQIETDVCRYVDFERKLTEKIDRFADVRELIVSQIQGLKQPNYMKVLFKVYVQYKFLKDAATEMNLSYSYTLTLHQKALKEFGKVYRDKLHYLM